ncbi:MAG TPA: hypothetical protein VFU46_11275 [Gemmatimonadales bacterium]|nr:hypothetical protein [Gemmatimonadales bacterium]
MTGALAYLAARSALNHLARRAAQLRQPRYLVALALGGAYLWAVLGGAGPEPPAVPAGGRWVELGGAVVLLGVAAWSWTLGGERRGLAFTPSEVTFLFPAPLTRRTLVHYRLAKLQVVIVVNVAIWSLLLGQRHAGVGGWQRAAALWVLLTTVVLHRTGAALARRSLTHHGAAGLRRRLASVAGLGLGAAAILDGLAAGLPAIARVRVEGGAAALAALEAVAAAPLAGVVLRPFRMLVAPLTAADPAHWALAIGPALVLLALHYVWVFRSDAAFEEAAAEWSLARARSGRRRRRSVEEGEASPTLLPLRPVGWPGSALLWKNLAATFRRSRVRTGLVLFGAIAAAVAAAAGGGAPELAQGAGALALTWAGVAVLLGPQWVRNDLRRDLGRLDGLRGYPVRGRTVVAADAAAATVSLTLLQLALLLLAYLGFAGSEGGETTLAERTLLLGAAILLLPPVNYLAMLVQNGAALLYPAWVPIGEEGPGGVEALGQNLVATMAFTLILGLLLLPPVGAGLLVARAADGGLAALLAGVTVGLGVLVAEAVLLVRRLGAAFERLEPSTPGITW